jgi:hypothetical protein
MNLATCQFHGGRLNERGLLVFCGKPSVPMASYCERHHLKIYINLHLRDPGHVDRLGTFKRAGGRHA